MALTNVGYIDSAIPRSNIRLRYDDAYGNNRPDRAEYFYPQCGCFFAGSSGSLPRGTRNAALRGFGPSKPEKKEAFIMPVVGVHDGVSIGAVGRF